MAAGNGQLIGTDWLVVAVSEPPVTVSVTTNVPGAVYVCDVVLLAVVVVWPSPKSQL